MIKTKKFKLTSRDYLRIILKNYLMRQKWIAVFFVLLLLLGILLGDIFFILLIPIFSIVVILGAAYEAYSPKNKIFFKERHFEIDGDFLSGYFDDGTTDKLNINNLIKIDKGRNYFLLYISKGHFIYIPYDCFESDSDRSEFETIIKSHLSGRSGG